MKTSEEEVIDTANRVRKEIQTIQSLLASVERDVSDPLNSECINAENIPALGSSLGTLAYLSAVFNRQLINFRRDGN